MMKTKIKYALIASLAAIFLWLAFYVNNLLPIATGYSSKYLCSAVFVSNRVQDDVEALDLNFSIISFVSNTINYSEKSVTSKLLWHTSKAVYREGLGSTLLTNYDESSLRNIKVPWLHTPQQTDSLDWPLGNKTDTPINNNAALEHVSTQLIDAHTFGGNVFAFVVVQKGKIITEHYAKGITAQTKLTSWSMAKSITNALVGIMVKKYGWDINSPTGIAEWNNDNKKNITLNHLLQMQSGLNWNEEYGNRSDVTLMLHCQNDFAHYAINKPLQHSPGSIWSYSSGSTNIINYIMRKHFNNDSAYYAFAQNELFHKIGIYNAVFEVDASGTQVGSSYVYATARDFARFGLLFLQNGQFNGEQILPNNWIDYTTTPASNSKNAYGASFWLNKNNYYPSAPADMYACNGHDGQRIFIIPSKEMVIVVLGYSPKSKGGVNFNALLKTCLQAIN